VTLETMKIPIPNVKIESEIITLVNKRTSDAYQNELNDLDDKINQLVYDMYDLDTEEREYIEGDVAY
jgi:type II restriction/modification system DNA methylase subunit YeeA